MANEANERKTIVLVDDNITNLAAGKDILKERYKTFTVPSAAVLFDLLEKIRADMILLDIEMPEMSGYEAIQKLKADPRWADIPVIFLTGRTDPGSEAEGLSLGAVDYVVKPFSASQMLHRIEARLR